MEKSKFLKLNLRDLLRGLIVAGISGGLDSIITMLSNKQFDVTEVGIVSLIAMVSYLKLNYFSGK